MEVFAGAGACVGGVSGVADVVFDGAELAGGCVGAAIGAALEEADGATSLVTPAAAPGAGCD